VNATLGKRSKRKMVVLGIVLIVILSAVEAGCLIIMTIRTRNYLRERSEERTAARRAAYRHKAYTEMNKRYGLRKSREALWNTITKG
jgi:hypothetical protein